MTLIHAEWFVRFLKFTEFLFHLGKTHLYFALPLCKLPEEDKIFSISIPPAFPTEWGKVIFSQMCVCPHPGGGTPARSGQWVPHDRYPHPRMEYTPPQARSGWEYPPPPGWDNRRSTCYAAGGMPLAFRQEDFLVKHMRKGDTSRDLQIGLPVNFWMDHSLFAKLINRNKTIWKLSKVNLLFVDRGGILN